MLIWNLYSDIEDSNADTDIYKKGKMIHVENNFREAQS